MAAKISNQSRLAEAAMYIFNEELSGAVAYLYSFVLRIMALKIIALKYINNTMTSLAYGVAGFEDYQNGEAQCGA